MRFQTGYYFRKGMVVQQDFEKGRLHCLWLKRNIVKKTSHFFFRVSRWGRGGGGGGGGGEALYAVLYGTCIGHSDTVEYAKVATGIDMYTSGFERCAQRGF